MPSLKLMVVCVESLVSFSSVTAFGEEQAKNMSARVLTPCRII